MASSTEKLFGELDKIKINSDRYIIPANNYIITIKTKKNAMIKAKECLYKNQKHLPLAVYCTNEVVFLIYSCVEHTCKHYLEGSHHAILSEYCSLFSAATEDAVACNIIEFESKTKLSVYIMYTMFSNFREIMIKDSLGKLTVTEVDLLTINEVKIFYKEKGLVWKKRSPAERYGELFKIKERQGTHVITQFSHKPDFRKCKLFVTFIFGEDIED